MILSMLLFCATNGFCQTFDEYFTDKTLRIDYIFSGNAKQQTISLDKLNTMPRWYGKRQRLAQVPVEGNGQITVRPHNSDKSYTETPSLPCFKNGCHMMRQNYKQII